MSGVQSWDFDSVGGSGGGKKTEFTKFPVGVTRIRIIDPAPHIRWVHWMNQFQRSVNCPGNCPIDDIRRRQKANNEQYTYNMQKKFSINIINRETGQQEIMEQGVTFFEDIRDLMEDLKDDGRTLLDVDLRVKRRGTGKDDTTYRIDIDEKYPLTDDDKKMVEAKKDLKEYFKPHTNEQILALLQVKENFKEAWAEITGEGSGNDNAPQDGKDDIGESIELK
jgi:hypothetical protein